ncbi:MAG: 4-(cytidine 5'-diphospho)-2-C-methyl-D-erythritol kinase [Clostridiaceae bacterium]|nr:4-(cytidine 5'-diphospho)-2-C-methyl-D-erythritol kinase [Clostridiaceae bacterium]
MLMPAKINLSIDVLNKRPDGYHSVEMIMQAIDLYDIVSVEKQKSGITLKCSHNDVPEDQRNIAWKAAEHFFIEASRKPWPYTDKGVSINIEKKIPVLAGLGGGSTDAAGVLIALNRLFNNCLDERQIFEIAKGLGADVAFFLKGGTQKSEGIGYELTSLPDFDGINLVLVKPDISVSTKWVYQNFDLNQPGERPDTDTLVNAIIQRDIPKLALGMRNVLESATIKRHPEISIIMEKMMEYGALGSRMSGSGPTVFGIYPDEKTAKIALSKLLKEYTQVFHNKTISRG